MLEMSLDFVGVSLKFVGFSWIWANFLRKIQDLHFTMAFFPRNLRNSLGLLTTFSEESRICMAKICSHHHDDTYMFLTLSAWLGPRIAAYR